MSQSPAISIFLDVRRTKDNGKYPIKLRVFTSKPRIQKLYPTKFEMSQDMFDEVWHNLKPSFKAHKQLKRDLEAIQTKANIVANQIKPFKFEQFEKLFLRLTNDGTKLETQFNQIIKALDKVGRVGTASSYDLSQKSIKAYQELKLKKKYSSLYLQDITPNWLQGFENYMIDEKGLSYTTVGIYLRSLRAIFNTAIEENEIEKELYPFGAKKYNIPTSTNKKKALNNIQLKTLFDSKPTNEHQAKAKDFWFFSYSCNGMNIKDICLLKHKDISEKGSFEFYRAKTKLTKGKKTTITVHLNDFAKTVIKKYGTSKTNPENYIFPILAKGDTPQEQRRKIQNFTRLISQHLNKICEVNGLPKNCSVMWARHSFATAVVRNGGTMEFVQESLGHASISTTQNYFAGFEDETKKEMSEQLMQF
jgi:integrase/recombinase XerD